MTAAENTPPMTSKTAISRGIDEINKRIESYKQIAVFNDFDENSKEFTIKAIQESLWILEQLLATEKKQHIDTFNAGTKARYLKGAKEMGLETLPEGIETGEQYFTKTFGQ